MRPQYFIVNGIKLAFVAATRAEKFIFTQEAGATQRECCAPTNPIFSCKQSQKRGRTAILWRPMCIGARRIPLCWKPLSGSRPANILKRARTLLWAHIRTACRALHLSTESMLHIVWGISGSIWIRWKRASFPSESQRRVSIPFSSSRVSSMEDVPHSWKMQRARRYYSICGRFRWSAHLRGRNTGAGAAGAVEKDRQTKAPADDVSAGAFLPDDGMPFKAAGQVLR